MALREELIASAAEILGSRMLTEDSSCGGVAAALITENGNIYLIDSNGNSVRKLTGHRSKVTQLLFHGQHLLSGSYDRTVNIWDANANKQEPVPVRTLASWVYCFALTPDDAIWIGDESGAISRVMISPDKMAERIQKNLKRDFSDDEWNYYIGNNVPRRRLMLLIH